MSVAKHVGIIMDGNGRWAERVGLSRPEGHLAGYENAKKVIRHVFKRGVEVLTLYAFSTENWRREEREVNALLGLFRMAVDEAFCELLEENIRIKFIGDRRGLPEDLVIGMERLERESAQNTGGILVPAINYGGRNELFRAVKKIAEKVHPSAIGTGTISAFLDTRGLPDPDLIIRTAGEMRLSGFLLYQAEYAELYFCQKLWPDFGKKDFDRALSQYSKRKRKYGRASP